MALPLIPSNLLTVHQLAREVLERLMRSRKQNSKLDDAYAWSISPVISCPGRTFLCERACYARRLAARRPNVRASWYRGFELTNHPAFADALALALKGLPAGVVRVHVSGDFPSPAYLRAWIRAVKGAPQLAPFAFTRSWRVPSMRRVLREEGWPAWILASTDAEAANAPREMREASMAAVSKSAVRAGKAEAPKLACPEQTGKADSCSACGRCPMARPNAEGLQLIPNAAKVGVAFLVH